MPTEVKPEPTAAAMRLAERMGRKTFRNDRDIAVCIDAALRLRDLLAWMELVQLRLLLSSDSEAAQLAAKLAELLAHLKGTP